MSERTFSRCGLLLTLIFIGAAALIILKSYSYSSKKAEITEHEAYSVTSNYTPEISESEITVLNEFRTKVQSRIVRLPRLKHDIFLAKWLQHVDFNLDKAEKMLNENVEWRDKENIWTIHEEDWSDLQNDYSYNVDYESANGNPMIFHIGNWDLRRASRNRERIARFAAKAFEEAMNEVDKKFELNKRTNQAVLIVDLENLSIFKSLCFKCMNIYIDFVTLAEQRYPRMFTNFISINTPGIFNVVLSLIMPFLSSSSQKSVMVLGGPDEWKPALLEMGIQFDKNDDLDFNL